MEAATVNCQLQLIKNNQCGFKCLTDAQWDEWKALFDSEVELGDAQINTRKTRKDAGQKRKMVNDTANSEAIKRHDPTAAPGQDWPSMTTNNVLAIPPEPLDQRDPPHFLEPTFGIEATGSSLAFPDFLVPARRATFCCVAP
ncbi:hypothetical protein FRC10_001160 [Ceratobasidium sp. 414]|nr:hypothetical protein FRC10_001160 [Ceratobasidium sp. 414]